MLNLVEYFLAEAIGSAEALTPNQELTGSLDTRDSIPTYVSATLTAGVETTFQIGNGDSNFNVSIDLLNHPFGEVLASSEEQFGSYAETIQFTPERDGTYFLRINIDSDAEGQLPYSIIQSIDATSESDSLSPIDASLTSITDPSLRNLAIQAGIDGIIDRAELIGILEDAGDGGVVSHDELTGLRIVSYNLPDLLPDSSRDYLQTVYNNVVLGNTANQWWTGGSLERESLGNLKAGASNHQLQKLIGKWFRGDDLPQPLLQGDSAAGQGDADGIYREATGTLFQDDIKFTDINQGALGDCWLLAAAASVASFQPDQIKQLFHDNGDGTYGVRFYGLTSETSPQDEHWVTVNQDLIVSPSRPDRLLGAAGSPTKSLDAELWPSLLEKALAQASETGVFQPQRPLAINSYRALEDGEDEGLAMLTGLPTQSLNNQGTDSDEVVRDRLAQLNDLADIGNLIGILGSDVTLSDTFTPYPDGFNPREAHQIDNNVIITLRAGHAFGLVDYNIDNQTVEIYNPWGPRGDYYLPSFTMSWDELIQWFQLPTNDKNLIATTSLILA